ncbi:hypothetical protein ACFSR9_15240 [Deinococcus taklimakanensis]|uniref:Uncharacterized protein n=1 Tax=Deinococcus taklimakanensis TaxID=536443 RepID=A0ABW5P8G9_9DEIO
MKRLLCALLLFGQASALSGQEIRSIAAKTLRGNILSAAALSTKNGDFMAVISTAYANGPASLTLLRKVGSTYIQVESPRFGSDEPPVDPQVWISDANRDGWPEVTWHYGAFGNVMGSENYTLYDTATKRRFESSITVVYGAPSDNDITYDPKLLTPQNKAFLGEVVKHLEASPSFKDMNAPDPHTEMIETWSKKYGAINAVSSGYVYAPPIKAQPGNCKIDKSSTITTLKVGTITYISQFKDGVYALNTKSGACALIYYPENSYEWVGKLLNVKGWIGMVNRNDARRVVYYEPTRQTLTRKAP